MKFPFIRLAGPYQERKDLPEKCPECECNEFYIQTDFRKSVGITMVFSASAATCVLLFQGHNWFWVWSPMLIALIIDRTLALKSPRVGTCYDCGLIFRNLDEKTKNNLAEFNLDTYDRRQYPHRTAGDISED